MHITFQCRQKRGWSGAETAEICRKAVLKSGVTKIWTVEELPQDCVRVMLAPALPPLDFFYDAKTRLLKADYTAEIPADDKTAHDKKSLVFALMKLLYQLKGKREYSVTDDCGAWEAFLETMRYQAHLRELTEAELARVQAAYDAGHREPIAMLRAFLHEDMQLLSEETVESAVMDDITMYSEGGLDTGWTNVFETWCYLTCAYKKDGRISQIGEAERMALDAFTLDLAGFILSMRYFCQRLEGSKEEDRIFGVPHGVTSRMLRTNVLPQMETADAFGRLVLTYRFFVSALEFNGLRFIGRTPEV